MNFKVKYRKAGAITIEDIEATDKAGVFAILKERGITAISIDPGPAAKSKSSANVNWQTLGTWFGIGAGVAGAVALGVWFSAVRALVMVRTAITANHSFRTLARPTATTKAAVVRPMQTGTLAATGISRIRPQTTSRPR